jgi:hypothetical protein
VPVRTFEIARVLRAFDLYPSETIPHSDLAAFDQLESEWNFARSRNGGRRGGSMTAAGRKTH